MNLHRGHFPVVSGGFRFWFRSLETMMDRKPRVPFRFRFPFRFAWVSNGNHHYAINTTKLFGRCFFTNMMSKHGLWAETVSKRAGSQLSLATHARHRSNGLSIGTTRTWSSTYNMIVVAQEGCRGPSNPSAKHLSSPRKPLFRRHGTRDRRAVAHVGRAVRQLVRGPHQRANTTAIRC